MYDERIKNNKNIYIYMVDYISLQGLFHNSLRNVGLFLSISLATLAVARYWRKSSLGYSILYHILSLFFLFASTYIAINVIKSQNRLSKDLKGEDKKELGRWTVIPKGVMVLNGIYLIISIFTLYFTYKERKNSKRSSKHF